MKKLWRVLTGRLMVVIPLILLQLGFFVILFYGYTTYGTAMPVLDILALIIAIYIINRRNDPSYKIGWLLLVLAAPVIGVPLYLITGNRKVPKKLHHGTVRATRSLSDLINLMNQSLMISTMKTQNRSSGMGFAVVVFQSMNTLQAPISRVVKNGIQYLKKSFLALSILSSWNTSLLIKAGC